MRGAVALALLSLASAPAVGQHLGERKQWQPQIHDSDPRLHQTVEIEILGRAAVPALAMLSTKTGVSLGVAPENLDTVGERKLTIISSGLTLKALMVQIPGALQECHWDIDANRWEPVYLLHRNAGVEAVVEKQRAERRALRLAEQKAQRVAVRRSRLEAARQALQMSPKELARIEETDPLLARAVQEPTTREIMQAFFALPDEDILEFVEEGQLEFRYDEAPNEVRRIARLMLDFLRRAVAWIESWPPEQERPPGFGDEDWSAEIEAIELKLRTSPDAMVTLSDDGAEEGSIVLCTDEVWWPVIPAQYVWEAQPGGYEHFLLVQTGDEWTEALEAVEELSRKLEAVLEARDRDDNLGVEEPDDIRLHRPISMPEEKTMTVHHIQQVIASQTGMSIISDFFTDTTVLSREDLPPDIPLWRLLARLSGRGVEWKVAGDCIVFHRTHWYRLAQREAPESLLDRWRKKLVEQGRFALEDIVQFAVELEDCSATPLRGGFAVPEDLLEAGADAAAGPSRGMLLLYHALTPEERDAASSPEGLRLSQLPPRKQREITEYVLPPHVPRAIPGTPTPEFVAATVFFLKAETGDDGDVAYRQYELRLQHPRDPGLSRGVQVLHVRIPSP